jgi:hypothetical protein
MPSSQQTYPDFSSLSDQAVARHLKLVWDQLNVLRTKEVDLSSFALADRLITPLKPLIGGGSLAADRSIRLDPKLFQAFLGGFRSPGGPTCYLTNSSNFVHTVTGTFVQVTFDTINEDNDAIADLPNSRLIIKTPGLYGVTIQQGWRVSTLGTGRGIVAQLNGIYPAGTTILESMLRAAGDTGISQETHGGSSRLFRFGAGDILTASAFQDSGGTAQLLALFHWLQVQWVRA